jgi:hypothetical protein
MKPVPGMVPCSSNDMADHSRPDTSDFYSLEITEYLDLNFGRGTWVLDPYEDRYVVALGGGASGRSYIAIGRDLRRFPVTIPAASLN